MSDRERMATALADALRARGIDAQISGRGVHWHVDAKGAAERSVQVHCFWYDRVVSGVVLGMNRANTRSALAPARAPYEGPEYAVTLRDRGEDVAQGRCRTGADDVIAAVRPWLLGESVEAVVRVAPFVDARKRMSLTVAEKLDPSLRWEIGGDPSYELWAYGDDRSCRVAAEEGGLACSFFLGQAQVAMGMAASKLPAAISAWLIERQTLAAMTSAVPWIELERHAEVLEVDPARWHWLHLLDRIANPHDVLAPMRELVEALSRGSVATAFYSFSSLDRLCFTASSHYPWVNRGLPIVVRRPDGVFFIEGKSLDLRDAVKRIESVLAASEVRPFFGSWPHHGKPLVDACLARSGSSLRTSLVQSKGWYELRVERPDGTRRCVISDYGVSLRGVGRDQHKAAETIEEATKVVIEFLEA